MEAGSEGAEIIAIGAPYTDNKDAEMLPEFCGVKDLGISAVSSAERGEHERVVRLRRRPSGSPCATCRSASMTNVARRAPQNFLPYIDFSPHTP